MATRELAYLPAPCNEEEVKFGLGWLARKMIASTSVGLVVIPTLAQLDGSDLTVVLGRNADAARKTRRIALPTAHGVHQVGVQTTATLRLHGAQAVLMLWVRPDSAAKVIDTAHSADILYVAWSDQDGQVLELLGFVNLRATPAQSVEPHPLVRAALESLSKIVNLGTGLAHSSDEASFVELLYLLQAENAVLEPDYVVRTLVSLGWRREHALEAGDRVRRFNGGTLFRRSRQRMFREDIVDQWRARATQLNSGPP